MPRSGLAILAVVGAISTEIRFDLRRNVGDLVLSELRRALHPSRLRRMGRCLLRVAVGHLPK